MRIKMLLMLMMVTGFSVYAQKKTQKAQAKDSVVFFYGTMELNNGLHVLTPIDSMKVPSNKAKQTMFVLNSNNRLRILKFAQTELANKDLRIKNARATMVLEAKGNLTELRAELDRFSNINKGSVFILNKFKFVKPEELKEGPGKKVSVY